MMDKKKLLCRICGKKALGAHYGVLSCKGCKEFFRRGIERETNYSCYLGNACPTDDTVKVRCKACRFRKCIELGMKLRGSDVTQKSYHRPKKSGDAIVIEINDSLILSRFPENGTPSSGNTSEGSHSHATNTPDDHQLINYIISSFESEDEDLQIIPLKTSCVAYYNSIQTGTPYTWLTDLIGQANRLSYKVDQTPVIAGTCLGTARTLEHRRQEAAQTVYAVGAAVQRIFGEQIANWTNFLNKAKAGQVPDQPETTAETMTKIMSQHNVESAMRSHKFAELLPGMDELDSASAKMNTVAPWKWMIFWMFNHAHFMTNDECYFTVGPQQYHCCRYWQDKFAVRPILEFMYKFCTVLRDIGLNQTEHYLLLAVIIFEPDERYTCNIRLKIIHRHYTDVLINAIRQRCSDLQEVGAIYTKLDHFFSILKAALPLFRHYYVGEENCPQNNRAMKDFVMKVIRKYATTSDYHRKYIGA